MTKPIDELLEWLHTFDDLQFSCNHRNVIEKIWQIKSKQQFDIPVVIVPKNEGTVCPHCKGSGKDEHDRCDPPNWYICDNCNGSGRTAL